MLLMENGMKVMISYYFFIYNFKDKKLENYVIFLFIFYFFFNDFIYIFKFIFKRLIYLYLLLKLYPIKTQLLFYIK
jgi:hypothetical protein